MVRTAIVSAFLICLAGCAAEGGNSPTTADASTDSPTPAAKASTKTATTTDRHVAVSAETDGDDEGAMDDIFVPAEELEVEPATDRCWADYCPCDESDPDYGYLDVSICRDQRMGVHVPDSVYSIGAKSRDARRSLREFDRDNP